MVISKPREGEEIKGITLDGRSPEIGCDNVPRRESGEGEEEEGEEDP